MGNKKNVKEEEHLNNFSVIDYFEGLFISESRLGEGGKNDEEREKEGLPSADAAKQLMDR